MGLGSLWASSRNWPMIASVARKSPDIQKVVAFPMAMAKHVGDISSALRSRSGVVYRVNSFRCRSPLGDESQKNGFMPQLMLVRLAFQ